MRTRRAWGLGVAAGLALLGAALPTGALGARPPRVGQPAPEITGGPCRVVLVEFWTYG